jgi:N-acetylglucosaminyldiphosphoundecaprenol N-acetyl-beta-D-mannosaminyltransferase
MLSNINYEDNLDDIVSKINSSKGGYVTVVNLNILTNMHSSEKYREIILKSSFSVCDSVNAWILNYFFGRKAVKKYPGPDLMKDILGTEKFKSVFVGGQQETLTGFSEKLKKYDSRINKEDIIIPPFLSVEEFDYPSIAEKINKKNPDIIWIGLGAPKQEYFIQKVIPFVNSGLFVGVGAAFDFYSGDPSKKRAPAFIRTVHLEWFYRALQEPKRIIPRQINSLMTLPKIVFSEIFRKGKGDVT